MAEELMNALFRDYDDHPLLSDNDQRLLHDIKPQRLHFRKGSVIFREQEPADYFFLVKEGVCFDHRHLADGGRQIMDLYFPGEAVSIGELSRAVHVSGLTAFSDTLILAYDKTEIKETFSRTARLSGLLIELIARHQSVLTDRLLGVARHSAKQRVAGFLLEMNQRQSFPSERSTGTRNLVRIPQVLIADVLGLSIVHINRVLRQFREMDCILIGSQGIELLDINTLKIFAGWQTGGTVSPVQFMTAGRVDHV